MQTRNRWPMLIILVGAGFLALSAWSFYRAASGASAVTDPDYYSHGLRYDQTLLERKTAAALGWSAVSSLSGRTVTITLRDRDQQIVAGAVGALTLLGGGNLPAGEVGLRETAPGLFQAELPAGLYGEVPAEISFRRDGARLSQRLLIALR